MSRAPLYAGRMKGDDMEVHDLRPLRQVCAECGMVIRDGRTVDGKSSHGLCPRHYRLQMAQIAVRAASRYGTAVRDHSDRQSDEVVAAHTRMVEAIYDIVDCPSEGPR